MHRSELTTWQKGLALLVWLAAATTFTSIGWDVIRPFDPQSPVSLLALRDPLLVWLQLAALAAVTSALATVILGRALTDAGLFATCLGLGALSLRGSTSEQLLLSYTSDQSLARMSLVFGQVLEIIAWTLMVAAAIVVSALTARWFYGAGRPDGESDGASTARLSPRLAVMAAAEIPRFGPRLLGGTPERGVVDLRHGLRHAGLVAAVMLAAMVILSIDSQHRAISHGQACFVVGAAGWLGTYFGFRYMPVRTPLWSLAAVPIVAFACCLWAAVVPVRSMLPATLPPSALVRPLPIQLVAVGCAGAVGLLVRSSPGRIGATAGPLDHKLADGEGDLMRWPRPSLSSYDDLRKKVMRETEAAIMIGLRFPHTFHRIPTVEVGKARFSREFAHEYWDAVLGLAYSD